MICQYDIIEAMKDYFKDDEEIFVEALIYLLKSCDPVHGIWIKGEIAHELRMMGRCPKCGAKLERIKIYEPHIELDDCPYEIIVEDCCPKCDWRE